MKKIRQILLLLALMVSVIALSTSAHAMEVENTDTMKAENPIVIIDENEQHESWLRMRPIGGPVYYPIDSKEKVSTHYNAEKSNIIPVDLAYYIAIQTIREVGAQDNFKFWSNANLSKPSIIENLNGITVCYLFQIIYGEKSVGEIAASATINEAPILFFSYNDAITQIINKGQKVVYIEGNGFAVDRNNSFYYCGRNIKADVTSFNTPCKSKEEICCINQQWSGMLSALDNDMSVLFDVSASTQSVPSSVNISTVQDYTWYQNCGSTAAAMVVDWYGRYKDPQLLLTTRPHSNSINSRLLTSSYFGSDGPNYTEWINGFRDYLDQYSSCTVSVSGVDHGNNNTTWTSYKNHIGATEEPEIVRFRYTSGNKTVNHAMAGVGYTGSYYRCESRVKKG